MATVTATPPSDASDPYVIFLKAIKTDATKKAYVYSLDKYLNYCKMADYSDLLRGENTELEARIMSYIDHLNGDAYSNSMRNLQLSAIKLFYYMNDKVLNWPKMSRLRRVDDNPRKDRAYSKDEITAMLKATGDPRSRAILLVYATSGIRKDALPSMQLKDLQYLESEKTFMLRVYPGSRSEYVAFVTPQASKYILRYLKTRFKSTAALPKDAYLITHNVFVDQKISVDSIERTVKELAVKVGIRTEDHNPTTRKDIMLLHGLRKFYNSTLAGIEGFNILYKERLLGHTIGLEASYLRPTDKQLLGEYAKAYKALTFDLGDI